MPPVPGLSGSSESCGGAAAGLPGDMPSWSDGLSDPEIHDLVIFIHTFCKKK
jgi:hypothetical protein